MLDLKQIRQQPDWFKEKLATRGVDAADIDAVLALMLSGGNYYNKRKI